MQTLLIDELLLLPETSIWRLPSLSGYEELSCGRGDFSLFKFFLLLSLSSLSKTFVLSSTLTNQFDVHERDRTPLYLFDLLITECGVRVSIPSSFTTLFPYVLVGISRVQLRQRKRYCKDGESRSRTCTTAAAATSHRVRSGHHELPIRDDGDDGAEHTNSTSGAEAGFDGGEAERV